MEIYVYVKLYDVLILILFCDVKILFNCEGMFDCVFSSLLCYVFDNIEYLRGFKVVLWLLGSIVKSKFGRLELL